MAPRVQPPPTPHRLREQATHHPLNQPVGSVHLGPGLYAAVLAAGGYVSSDTGTVPQSPEAIRAIVIGFSLVPAALILLSLVALRAYRLERAEVDAH